MVVLTKIGNQLKKVGVCVIKLTYIFYFSISYFSYHIFLYICKLKKVCVVDIYIIYISTLSLFF